MTSDLDLLRRFARENSQDAFAEIVRRHLNLVYSAALRQVRSRQLAEEVAQSVFTDLARNAGSLARGGACGSDASSPESGSNAPSQKSLAPWLYTVTRRTAIDLVRKESRRQFREQIAVEMTNMNATSADWTQIEPLLDDAMAALEETDRSAILLRYFENKSLREVGESLNVSDDAAQKRMSRAVERLREFFSKRNVKIGTSGLVVLISANAIQAAPIGLAATISAAPVLAGIAAHTSTAIAATKTIVMTALQKILIIATLIAAAGAGIYEVHRNSQSHEQIQVLRRQVPLIEQIQQPLQERNNASEQLIRQSIKTPQLQTAAIQMQFTSISNFEPEPTAELWTYPPNLRQLAFTNFARAIEKLTNAKSETDRYLALGDVAKLTFVFGKTDAARNYAVELLALDQKFQGELWRNGDAAFDGNLVLGRIALQNGQLDEAKQYLVESGKTIGSPVLDSFGPNMTLARDLLQNGERDTVLQYFELCRKFWDLGNENLTRWTQDVKDGKMPDFGGNLYY